MTDLERVARAIYEVSSEPEHGDTWEALSDGWRENFRKHARAALLALLPPSAEMVEAGGSKTFPNGNSKKWEVLNRPEKDFHRQWAAEIFEAMIRKAIGE